MLCPEPQSQKTGTISEYLLIMYLLTLNLASSDGQKFGNAISPKVKAICSGTRFRAWM